MIEYKLNLYSYASNLGFNVEPYRFLPFFNGCVEMLESGYSITPNGDILKESGIFVCLKQLMDIIS